MRFGAPHWLALALTSSVFLAAEGWLAGRVGPALDDGWIYLSFARAFGEGDWFSYPGAAGPAGAITAPLWSFVLAIGMAIGGANPITAKVLGVLVFVAMVAAVGRLARAATGDPALARLAQLATALTPRLAWASLSGMEAGLGVTLVAWGIALHLERRDQSTRRWSVAALVLALAGWSRPESFVFLWIAALHRRRATALAIAGAMTATFPLFHLIVYGYPLPLPFYAKAIPGAPLAILRSGSMTGAARAAIVQIGQQCAAVIAMLGAGLPLVLPGLLRGWCRGLKRCDGVPFLVFAGAGFVAARGLLGMQAPTFQQGRYFVQLVPLFLVVGLHGFDRLRISLTVAFAVVAMVACGFLVDPSQSAALAFDFIRREPMPSDLRLQLALCWVPFGIAVLLATVGLRWLPDSPTRRSVRLTPVLVVWLLIAAGFGAVRHGEGVRDTYAINVAMAENVARLVPERELVACHDLGALGWFARRPLLDLAGLASSEVAFAPRDAKGRIDVVAILERLRPGWLCLTDEMLDKLNPDKRLPSGLLGWNELEAARVTSHENVTVLGDAYRLIRLTWAR
ncbi:MAG: hypothetical protein U1F36_20180 [Planctomycetota bacterium]